MRSVHRNLPTLQALMLLFMFDLTLPLRQLIYSGGGLSSAEIGIVLAAPWVVVSLADVPTGRLADEYNYKAMIITGFALLASGFGVMGVAQSFLAYLASAILLGAGAACYRGIPPALGSVSLGTLDNPQVRHQYNRFVQWGLSLAALGEAIASLAAVGLLRVASYQIIAFMQMGICLCMAIIAAFYLTDIRPANTHHHGFRKTLAKGWHETFSRVGEVFATRPIVRAIVLYGATVGCTTQTMVWLSQAYLQRTGTPPDTIPLIWFLYHVTLFVFTLLIAPLQKLLGGQWGILVLLPLIAAAAYLTLIWVPPRYGTGIMVVFYFVRAMQMGIVIPYLALLVPENLRATIMAVMSTLLYAMYAVMIVLLYLCVQLFPRVGYGTGVAFGVSAVVYGAGGMGCVWFFRRHRHEKLS